MKTEIRAQWFKDSETSEECLIDLDTNQIILRRRKGVMLSPEPTTRLLIRIVETPKGYDLDIVRPEKVQSENPETYTKALAKAIRVIMIEATIEAEKLRGGSMEVL